MTKSISIVYNGIIVTSGKALCVLLSTIAMIFVARRMGNAEFGKISVVFAYLMIFQSLAQFGLDTVFVREASRAPEQLEAWFSNALVCKLLLALAAVVLSCSTLFFMSYSGELKFLIILASFSMCFSFHTLIPGIFQIRLQTGHYVLPELIVQSVTSLLLIAASWSNCSVTVIVAILVYSVVPLAVTYVAALNRVFRQRFFVGLSLQKMTRLLRESLPLFLSGICVSLCLRLDQLILYKVASDETLGMYAAAVRIVELPNFVPGVVLSIVFPLLNASCQSAPEEFERISRMTYRVMSAMVVPVMLLLAFFSREIVQLLYGPNFAGASGSLSILAFCLIWLFLGSVHSSIILARGLQNYLLFFCVIGGVLSIGSYLLLIPAFGVTGAAIASIISYSSVGMITQFLMPKTRHATVLYYKSIIEILPAAVAMATVLWFKEELPVLAVIPLSLMLYLLLLFSTKVISQADVTLMKQMFRDFREAGHTGQPRIECERL